MRSIGGYIRPGIHRRTDGQEDVTLLNTGRNALECLLRIRGYRVLYAPIYTCGVLREPIARCNVELRYYNIDKAFNPLLDLQAIGPEEGVLYTNYFGLKDQTIEEMAQQCPTLIVDQAQAFYAPTPHGVDAFDSVRKYFGVPDGSRLRINVPFNMELAMDQSSDRCDHLLLGADQGAERGYGAFQRNEARLSQVPPGTMSQLTRALLSQLDHAAIIDRRRQNHHILHQALARPNALDINPMLADVPFVYPFLSDDPELRHRLLSEKVFIPTYWPELLAVAETGMPEALFRDHLLCLPVDQRHGPDDMHRIIDLILH